VSLNRARWVLAAALLLFTVRAGLYIQLLPVNEMPDELEHVRKIILARDWPRVANDRAAAERLMREVSADYYLLANRLDQRPPLDQVEGRVPPPERRTAYFRFCGWLLRVLGVESIPRAWYLIRALSWLFGLAVLLCGWGAARSLAPERPILAAATAGFLALLPQFGAMSAVASTDKPAELAGAVFFLLMVRIARRPARLAWLGAGLIIICLPLVKKTTFFLVLVALAAALPWWRGWLGRLRHGRLVGLSLSALVTVAFLGAVFVPWGARWTVKLAGMPLLRIWHPLFDDRVFRQPGMINALVEHVRPLSPAFWHQVYFNLQSLFQSWWGTFGFQTLPLPAAWYWSAWLLVLLALAGLARLLFRPGREWSMEPWQGRALGLLVLGAGLNLAVILTRQIVFAPGSLSQGRYMFPSLVPWAVVGCLAFLALWPRRLQAPALVLGLTWLAAMDLAGLWRTIVPYYYSLVL